MSPALFLVYGLVVAMGDNGPGSADLATYRQLEAHTDHGADAQVKLALWCEAHGLSAERIKHLARAVLTEPTNAAARGLMGLVAYQGQWARPEAVTEKVKADASLSAALARYNARRDKTATTADAQWKLALWCEESGLDAEAKAHLATVVRLDPSREDAWKHLGCKKVGGRWLTEDQLAAEKAEADIQKKADRHWKPLLAKWRDWLRDASPKKRADAQANLDSVSDARAVPMIWAVLATGDASDQAAAVPVFARLDGPAAGRALAMIAVFGKSPEVSRAAAATAAISSACSSG